MGTIWESILQEYSTNLCSCALVMLKLVFVLTLALAVAEDEEPWKKMKWRKEICEQSKSTDEVSGENDMLKKWKEDCTEPTISDDCKWFLEMVSRAEHIDEVALKLNCEEMQNKNKNKNRNKNKKNKKGMKKNNKGKKKGMKKNNKGKKKNKN